MDEDYYPPPMEADIGEIYESILEDAGRPISLDEWSLIVECLRWGRQIVVWNGVIGISPVDSDDYGTPALTT